MALLSAADLATVWGDMMANGTGEPLALLKTDLSAAVAAVDSWCDSNATSFNTAIPLPARTSLTVRQKALLLAKVAIMRAARA
jgi:hypothetical protein